MVYETRLPGRMGDNKTHHFTPFLLAKPEEGGVANFLLNMSHLPSCGILIPKMPLHLIPVIEEPLSSIIAECVGPFLKMRYGNQYQLCVHLPGSQKQFL